ncbi:Protein of unknown function [Bacillus wiedmannii]|nr:Protein of unknown function [Bacillus wiedmannii]
MVHFEIVTYHKKE